jgi:hypothetical protein
MMEPAFRATVVRCPVTAAAAVTAKRAGQLVAVVSLAVQGTAEPAALEQAALRE